MFSESAVKAPLAVFGGPSQANTIAHSISIATTILQPRICTTSPDLFLSSEQPFVKEYWFVSSFGAKSNCRIQALEVVSPVIEVERPKVLFVCEQIHNFSRIGIVG